MFPHTWRARWGLDEDPFVHEDADKDPVLRKVDAGAVHASFDRLFGDAEVAGPSIVFGEKGSGKSALRLAMLRRLDEHDAARPEARVFRVEYTDFDAPLDQARRADRLPPGGAKVARRVVERFTLADHLDAILSIAVTALVDEVLARGKDAGRSLTPSQRLDVLALAALYDRSDRRGSEKSDKALRRALRRPRLALPRHRAALARLLLLVVGALAVLAPLAARLGADVPTADTRSSVWLWGGGFLLGASLGWTAVDRTRRWRRANKATRAVRVVPRDPRQLMRLLRDLSPAERAALPAPESSTVAPRLALLQRFVGATRALGFCAVWILVDRVDEATYLGGRAPLMERFVESLLHHRVLQLDGVALKLFLPIELSRLYLGAGPDELKAMRLDKANTVPELRWTGQELLSVANERLRAVHRGDGPGATLRDYFDDEVTEDDLRSALADLGTPRLAFGFLDELFAAHARELPDDLEPDDPRWSVPHRRFDLVRASFGDKARALRRAMN